MTRYLFIFLLVLVLFCLLASPAHAQGPVTPPPPPQPTIDPVTLAPEFLADRGVDLGVCIFERVVPEVLQMVVHGVGGSHAAH